MNAPGIRQILEKYSSSGSVIALIGVGKFGSAIRREAEALGRKVLLCDPPRAENESIELFDSFQQLWGNGMGGCDFSKEVSDEIFLPPDEVLSKADLICVQIPLTESGKYPTKGLIDAAFFARLRSGAKILSFSDPETASPEVRERILFFI